MVQVIDETTLTDTITVNVTISNVDDDDPVVANAIADVSANEDDGNLVIDLSNVFNDVDSTNASITKAILSNSNSALVTSTISGDNLTLDYQADQSGSATITVRATSNGKTVDDAFTVTVTAVDDDPVVANAIADVSANQDDADLVIDLANVFNDIDNANASITKLVSANDNTALVTTSVVGNNLTLDFQASQSGVANITIRATSNSVTVVDSFVVTVTAPSAAPVITQGAGPLPVTMSEDGSPTAWAPPTLGATDADTSDSTLVWNVSTPASSGTATVSGTAAAPSTFTYAPNADFNGSDSFVVQVSDGSLTDTITVNVIVSGVSDAPVITQGAGPLPVTMSEDGSPTSWSTPTLGATDVETADSALVWSVSSAATSGTADVSGTAATPSTFTYAPNADFNGSDSFVVQVTDGASLTDTITVNVTVSGVSDAPVITQGAGPLPVTMSEDGSPTAWATPTLGATDVETADSALVWSVSTPASSGTADVSGTAATPSTFTYAPNADFNGSDSFVVQVTDGASLTDTITVNVTVSGVSDAPVITQGAGPLVVTMSEDGSPTAWSVPTLGATDVETADSALVWSVSTPASSGTATVSGTAAAPSTFTYAPNADFNGSDSFVVQVTDGASLTDTITVNVTVSGVSDAPVITQGAGPLPVTMSEDGSPTAWATPTLGATDVETADSALVWSVSTPASSGTATVSGTAAAPSTFTYAPNADFNGSDSFVVQVTDGASLTDTITVNVTVSGVSDAPVITQGAGPLVVTMSEDGSPTAWSVPTLGATDAETADSSLVWSVSSAATSGTADVSGTAATPSTFTYVPNADFNGSDSFVVQVTDGASLTDTITVNVTVSGVSDAPVITQGAGPLVVTMSEDGSPTAWSVPTLGATDVETADSALVWSVSTPASSGTATVSGTAAAPSTFTYAPNADFNGSDSFVVQVTDGASLTDTITVNVTVSGVSDAPVITPGSGPLARDYVGGWFTHGMGDTHAWRDRCGNR